MSERRVSSWGAPIYRRARGRAALYLMVLVGAGALLVILLGLTCTVVFFALLFGSTWR